MDELFEAYIIHALKQTGYTNCSNRALQMFKAIFMKKMMYHCKSLKQVTHHATRHKSIALDIFNIENDPTAIAELPGTTLDFEVEVYKPKEKFVNEIASKIDRYIHIYEFMPEFPPTHTFKRSYIRNAKKHEIRIKQRVEQNLLAERSVFQMVSMEGKMPRHVNFMDYMEK